MLRLLIILFSVFFLHGCNSTVDPITRLPKMAEAVMIGGKEAVVCAATITAHSALSGNIPGALQNGTLAGILCGMTGVRKGMVLDEYEKKLLNELESAGVRMTIRKNTTVLEIEEPITFAHNSIKLSDENEKKVIAVGEVLIKYSNRRVDILGHRTPSENPSISLKRAGSVKRILRNIAGAEVRIKVIDKSDSEPLGDNTTETGRSRSRRILIFFALSHQSKKVIKK